MCVCEISCQRENILHSNLGWKLWSSTLEAAVLARICVQCDRLVLTNTFQEGTVPAFGVKDAE